MTTTNQIKSQLARLLATENITVMHSPGAKTAAFDVKNRNLILPVWQNISDDLYDMLVVHETGHALDTPGDAWVDHINNIAKKYHPDKPDMAKGAIKNFMNVIEDARIDKRQKRRYPGSRRNYVAGYKELFERNFFGTMGRDVNSFGFIDRVNMYFKGGVALGIKFSPAEMVFVKRIDEAETFDEVIQLTEDIYKFCLEAKKTQSETASNDIDFEESEDDIDFDADYDVLENEDGDHDDGNGSISTDGDDESDEDTSGDEDCDSNTDSGEDDSDVKSKPRKNSEVGGSFDSNENDIPDSETEKAANKNLDTIVRNDDVNYIYLTLPKYNVKNIVDDFSVVIPQMESEYARYKSGWTSVQGSRKNFMSFKQKENDTISFMVKEFEMKKRADTYSRTRIAKTGVIDTNKMFSYKYNDDIFRRTSVVPEGKNYGFCMFLDWSGSMVNNIEYTMKQLMSLVMFCKRVQIPFEVYLFRESSGEETTSKQFDYKYNDIIFRNFKLRNILSSRMNTSTLNKAFEILFAHATSRLYFPCDKMESTPLNQAIVVAETVVNDFRKKNKLQGVNTIFLTDGVSDLALGYHKQRNTYLPHKPKGNMYILNDTVMKKSYNINSMHGQGLTDTLLTILKDHTQCNLIGFYLHNGSLRSASYLIDPYNAENKKQWSDNGYIAISSKGYDDYYIINSQTKADSDFSIAAGTSKQKLASAFIKFSEKKTVNRVLLSKFMDKVCRVA